MPGSRYWKVRLLDIGELLTICGITNSLVTCGPRTGHRNGGRHRKQLCNRQAGTLQQCDSATHSTHRNRQNSRGKRQVRTCPIRITGCWAIVSVLLVLNPAFAENTRSLDPGSGLRKSCAGMGGDCRNVAIPDHVKTYFTLGVMHSQGLGADRDPARAAEWFGRAAELGHPEAQYLLGAMYEEGRGVPLDDSAAASWYRKAAAQGHIVAQYNLGVMLVEGRGVKTNDTDAVSWLQRAAEQGSPDAQNVLGILYSRGQGVEANDEQAAHLFRLAAEQGNPDAQNNLGLLYRNGRGVEISPVRAKAWLKLAASNGHQGATRPLEEIEKQMSATENAEAEQLFEALQAR